MCVRCAGSLRRLLPPLCARCGAPTAWPVASCAECSGRRIAFASARAAVAYAGASRSAVLAWKERALRPIGALAAELVVQVVPRPAADVITYIPPDGDRSLKRGHHPAQRLARELASAWGLELCTLVSRRRRVAQQATLPLAERRRNVRGAFRASGDVPGRVVLVDDVYTSGATVNAASSALRAGGARRVDVVTFARAVR
jgi:predicted amidophosphoribosyltransferase